MSRTSRLLALFFVVVLGVSALYVSLPGAPVAQAQGPTGTITPATTTLTNDGSQGTVTVEVLNGGVAVQGASVAVAVASVPSPLPAGVTLSALNGTTGADGRFNVTVSYLPATSETLQLTFTASATVGGNPVPVAGSAVVNFVKAPASPTFSIVSLADATLGAVPADNFSETRIVVQLRDSQRRSPGAKRVRLELESGTTDGLTPALPVEADTDSAGNFTFAVKSSLPKDVVFRVFNVTDNFMVQGRPSVSFYAAPPTAISTVTVTPDPANVLGNGVDLATITVTAKGQGGNALEGVQVTLNGLDAFYNGGDTAPKTTGADGRAVFTVSSGRTDLNRVFTVTLQRTGPGGGSPVTLNVPAINFTAAPAIEANSSISAPPGSVPADNTATKVITVFVRNQGNFGIPGKEVRLTASSPDVTITPSVPTFLTDNEGKIEFTVSSRAAGDVTFTTNQIDGFTKSIVVNFTAAPTDPAKSTITRDPTGNVESNGSRVLVTVTLVNAGMLPVTGHTVVLNPEPATPQAVQDALIIEAAPDGNPTDNNYLFYVSAIAPNALGDVQFQATDVTNNVTLSTLLTINFIAPSVSDVNSRVDVVGEPPSALLSVVADNTATATIRVTVKDANGNPLPGRSVTLIADNANVTITPSTPTQTS
ncbi:MAG: Ig-like domain-containing protein, partial [Anaerolineae bacterium]|nr:Ig-like domain-containing protein [Anaerolineae bacterium]